jgi:hypothetical protein
MSRKPENLGAVDFVSHYRVTKDLGAGTWRVVNTKNGIINKNIFKSRKAAFVHARKLAVWHKGNTSSNGKARTNHHNLKVVAAYHASKGGKHES